MDCTRLDLPYHTYRRIHLAGALAMALLPAMSFADGVRIGQKAQPGDIVLTRNVAARPADRNATAPGMALLVNPSPNPQLGEAINGSGSTGEITDTEIANLTAGVGSGNTGSGETHVQRALNSALGTNLGGNSAGAASNGVSNLVGGSAGATGAVADSTRSIGEQVTNAVSQIPMPGVGH